MSVLDRLRTPEGAIEAEYADGFVLSERKTKDQSIYIPMVDVDGVPSGPNTMNDVVERRPEADHGRMVRFSVYRKRKWHHWDWKTLPYSARPIRYRDFERDDTLMPDGIIKTGNVKRLVAVRAGYIVQRDKDTTDEYLKEL